MRASILAGMTSVGIGVTAIVLGSTGCTPTAPRPDRTKTVSRVKAHAKMEVAAAEPRPQPETEQDPTGDTGTRAEPENDDDIDAAHPVLDDPEDDESLVPRPRISATHPPVCITPTVLPEDLPDYAKACLGPLLEVELGARFLSAPAPGAMPCATQRFDEEGEILDSGIVERFAAKERRVRFETTDEYSKTVIVRIETLGRHGRPTKVVRHYQSFAQEPPDTGPYSRECETFSTIKHRYNDEGWPRWTEDLVATCEGVDAGTTTTTRTFTEHDGWIEASLSSVLDNDDPLPGRELWSPTPDNPSAHVTCDEDGDCTCSVQVLGCDGTELGTATATEARVSFQRWRWSCP